MSDKTSYLKLEEFGEADNLSSSSSLCRCEAPARSEAPLLGIKELSAHSLLSSHFSASLLEKLERLGMKGSKIEALRKCGSYTGDLLYLHCEHDNYYMEVKVKHRCNSRVCPDCSKRLRMVKFRELLKFFSSYEINPKKAETLRFLTIAPESYLNVHEGIIKVQKLVKDFMRLVYRRKSKYAPAEYVRDRIKGLMWVVETTKDKNNLWHVHLHCIYFGKRLDNKVRIPGKDSRLVRLLTSVSDRKVNAYIIDAVKKDVFKKKFKKDFVLNDKEGLVNYMVKFFNHQAKTPYSNGFMTWTEQEQAEYINAISDQRLVSMTGCFYQKRKGICLECSSKVFKKIGDKYQCSKCSSYNINMTFVPVPREKIRFCCPFCANPYRIYMNEMGAVFLDHMNKDKLNRLIDQQCADVFNATAL